MFSILDIISYIFDEDFLELLFILFFVFTFLNFLNLKKRINKLELILKNYIDNKEHKEQIKNLNIEVNQFQPKDNIFYEPLINYIKSQIEQNVSKEDIVKILLDIGWQMDDIEKGFSFIKDQIEKKSEDVLIRTNENQKKLSEINIDLYKENSFVRWLKEDWLLKLGALLLIIGFGWFTTYAFLNNWIGPIGRITLGIFAGVLFILIGWIRIKKFITQGGIFLVLGSTTILLTVFAARTIYDFFDPFSALLIMFLSTAFVGLASIKYNNKALSILSLILASIAPLLTNAPDTDHIGLFAYLLVVVLGAIWIITLTGQTELNFIAIIIVLLYSLPHIMDPGLFPLADNQKLILFAYAFVSIFFVANIISIIKLNITTNLRKENLINLINAGLNAMLLLSWVLSTVDKELQSLIISAWMIVFLFGSFLIFKFTNQKQPFFVYAGIGIVMLATATAAELKGQALVVAYTLEVAVISLLIYFMLKDIKITQRFNLLFIFPIILSLNSIYSRKWNEGIIHSDFFVLLILGLSLFILGLFYLPKLRFTENYEIKFINNSLLVIGSFYFYILLWLSLHYIPNFDDFATMICLTIYTIIGLISYFYGLSRNKKGISTYGKFLVGIVIIRLLLVDIWWMNITGRIITFFLIGVLLISTAFLKRAKN